MYFVVLWILDYLKMNYVKIISSVLLGLVVLSALLFMAGYYGLIGSYRAYVILSGSMEPGIKTGSIVVARKEENYVNGEVITFAQNGDKKSLVTHRIFFKKWADGGSDPVYLTAGDANEEIDRGEVKPEWIIGKAFLVIPYLGYMIDYVKRPQGFILLVVVPATIIVYEELRSIKQEVVGTYKKRKKRNDYFWSSMFYGFGEVPGEGLKENTKNEKRNNFPKLALVLPVGIAAAFLVSVSGSFFSDAEKTVGNVLSAAISYTTPSGNPVPTGTPSPTSLALPTSTPTPSPGNLAILVNEVYSDGQAKGEWVELFNPNAFPVDVSGWMIADKNAYDNGQDDTFPTSSPIPAGGYAVVITNQTTVAGIPASAITIELINANIGSGLDDDGDAVVLKNPSNAIIDAMNYGNVSEIFPSPPGAPSSGQSLARSPNGSDTNGAVDWSVDGTPTLGVINN